MDHCSDAVPENWAVRLKKQTYEGTWEVRTGGWGEAVIMDRGDDRHTHRYTLTYTHTHHITRT